MSKSDKKSSLSPLELYQLSPSLNRHQINKRQYSSDGRAGANYFFSCGPEFKSRLGRVFSLRENTTLYTQLMREKVLDSHSL